MTMAVMLPNRTRIQEGQPIKNGAFVLQFAVNQSQNT